jgi:dsDNA-binding SOS-regulon protein
MKKKSFAITASSASKAKRTANVLAYCGLLFIAFCFFTLYSGLTNLLFSPNKIDIFKKDLTQISAYFLLVDREVSKKLLTLNDLLQSYLQGDNILQTKTEKIEELRRYITENRDYLSQLGFQNYDGLMDFLAQAYTHREEIYMLLGKNQPFTYLVILQNGNEKRPNGGFFGSFAVITLEGGHLTQLQIVDSYLPDYIAPTTRVPLPQRFSDAFGESEMGFIAGNKFGFTDQDGKNLKTLYERMFNQEYHQDKVDQMFNPEIRTTLHDKFIKGVVFLNSNLIADLLPGFTQKARERQFLNAAVDLIRGEVRSNKKELYIQKITQYFNEHQGTLLKNVINHRETLLQKRYLNMYFSNSTTGFHTFLVNNALNTEYSPDTLYARDTNTASNKSDAFITKELLLLDAQGQQIASTSLDTLSLKGLNEGTYTLQIAYDFNVPDAYVTFIRNLEKTYEIKLTPREEDILVL